MYWAFKKITGSHYHFIAYLSLLNDRPNSFYHLNFNIFFRILVTGRRGGERTFVFNFKLYFSKSVTVLQWFAIHLTCLCVQTYAGNQENYFSIRTFFLRKFYLFLKLDLVSKLNLDSIWFEVVLTFVLYWYLCLNFNLKV